MLTIRADDLTGAAIQSLIVTHLAGMRASSPPGSVFALDLSGLQGQDITTYTAWRGKRLAGMGALRRIDSRVGEVKSMRTHADFLRQGVAQALLEHILQEARALGLHRISLETGRGPAFEPALSLYRNRGFRPGEAFGDYAPSAFNQFLHLEL